ncbi:hypothetical protein [Kineosporia sp. NBRC 101731]|uniref:hypothetical protein n=1 Tax=Kineosporia sp. NBRC 101731 TaxID=3032199 RepID=UPI0024A2F92B|nr:hypothetical protein [Kineosporia sp. NBRC 101731]GLY28878.1 hypothetical protein Kisp02_22430 [Kineosporia sp. NBRC 101731]
MADIEVAPGTVRHAVDVVNDHQDTIVDELERLLSAVTALLTHEGGLWLQQSSPVTGIELQAFSRDLQQTITIFRCFAESFTSTVTDLEGPENPPGERP